jgi:putative intracellular protease/amidase
MAVAVALLVFAGHDYTAPFEYHTITSGACGQLNGCASASDEAECKAWGAHIAQANSTQVKEAINPAPLGCYLFKESHQLWFNSGAHEKSTACTTDRKCVCRCAPGIDVAMYHDEGASSRGKANIFHVLNYEPGMRVHNFSADEVARFLHADMYDVVFFPGGGGSTEQKAIGDAGDAAIKAFLAAGGGYVGVCAGAYLALDHLKLAPFRNLPKKYGDRGDGNCSLSLTAGSGLASFVDNATLRDEPVFYGGGHSTAQHSTAQHSTAQHSTAQHSTAQHSTAQHSTAQHSIA